MIELSILFFQFVLLFCVGQENNNRKGRTCHHKPYSALDPFYRKSIFESTTYLLVVMLLGILFGLMLLGLLKGILGVVGCRRMGRCGLEMLIDLPKPLDRYQERELKHRTVCYDVAGWPVHPDTGERTVRLLPMQTEFCLNIIFFLAYPLALVLKLCSFCCCIKNSDDVETCYRQVNIIRCKSQVDPKNGPNMDIYQENDLREANDTSYVINCMKESQMSLEKLRNSFH